MSPLHVISLGAGVQSSAMALMAAHGELTPMPTCAIFADTQSEPQAVYDWLDVLEPKLPFPVYRVTAGNLAADFMAVVKGERKRCSQPPFYVKQPNSANRGGMLWRQCTQDYKLRPIVKRIAELKKAAGATRCVQWIGISLDEAHRRKGPIASWIENYYPLVDERKSRWDCVRWLLARGYPEPPKSACKMCPYINNERWKRMKEQQPEEFEQACQYDEALRAQQITKGGDGAKITGELFVHRSMTPLREAVLTDTDVGQGDLFANECEGMCGV